MEAIRSSETLVPMYKTAPRHAREDRKALRCVSRDLTVYSIVTCEVPSVLLRSGACFRYGLYGDHHDDGVRLRL